MNFENLILNLAEKVFEGDFIIGKYNPIPESKLVVLKQNSSKWWIQIPTPKEMGITGNRKRLPTDLTVYLADEPSKYDKKSFLAACRLGLKTIYDNDILQKRGLPLFELKPTVKSISLKVIEKIESIKNKKGIHGDYIRVLEKEIIPQLGNLYLQDLRLKEITEFFKNKQYSSSTTITVARTVFDKIFNYAELNNLILTRDRPSLSKLEIEVDQKTEYVSFIDDDIEIILKNMQSFINNTDNKIAKENRELFRFYTSFLKTTGIRAGKEATGILWKDIYNSKSGSDRVVVKIAKGKIAKSKGRTRNIRIDKETIENLMKLLLFQTGFNSQVEKTFNKFSIDAPVSYGGVGLKHNELVKFIKMLKLDNKPIFARKIQKKVSINGKINDQFVIPIFGDCFKQLKPFLGEQLSDDDLVLYSYRHYFITDKLINGMEPLNIALYCGTSVEMIEKHYSKVKAERASEFVIKDLDLDTYKLL